MSVRILPPPADMFASGAYAICVGVNCVGVPGKGVALEAAKLYPEWAKHYRETCRKGGLRPGGFQRCYVEEVRRTCEVIGLAVKDHWRDPSRLEWVEQCLHRLAEWCCDASPPSVAVCALGCGLGRLSWDDVRPMTERILGEVRGVMFDVYAPHEAPRRARR